MADASVPNPRYSHAPTLRHICKGCGKPFLAHATVQVACGVECKFAMYQNKGEPDACWNWNGPLLGGYGLLFLDTNKANGRRNSVLAHRYSYISSFGELTDEKPCVLHSCDNPRCTNPAHLRAGTRGENNTERSAKGRSGSKTYTPEEKARYSEMFRGAANLNAKLTDDQARAIKHQHAGLTQLEVARMYGVSKSVVGHIRTGRSWRHI